MATNRLIAKGNIGKFEVHNQDTDDQFVTGSICASEYTGKNEDGSPRYTDQWFDFIAFGGKSKLLRSIGIKVGDRVEIEGPMRSRPRKDEEAGVTYENWAVHVNEVEVIFRRPEEANA